MPQNRLILGNWNAICSHCGINKPKDEYMLRSDTGKYRKQCRECFHLKGREWREQNPEKATILAQRTRINNRERMLEAARKWRRNNKAYDAFRARTYRARKQQQLPAWADLTKIKEIYLNCPEGYHVDHIVPLKGKIVSGLHVEYNLQYLPARENLAKRNIYHAS